MKRGTSSRERRNEKCEEDLTYKSLALSVIPLPVFSLFFPLIDFPDLRVCSMLAFPVPRFSQIHKLNGVLHASIR